MIQCCINLITPLLQSLAPVACNEALMLCLPRKCRERLRKWASSVLRKICSLVERKVYLIWYQYILYIFVFMYIYVYIYTYICIYVYKYVYMVTPQDLPKSVSNCIYNMKCVFFLYYIPNFTRILVIPSKCKSQNTEKHGMFVYAFLKTCEKSPAVCFWISLYYHQTRTVREHKTNRVTLCICINLSLPNLLFISKKSCL